MAVRFPASKKVSRVQALDPNSLNTACLKCRDTSEDKASLGMLRARFLIDCLSACGLAAGRDGSRHTDDACRPELGSWDQAPLSPKARANSESKSVMQGLNTTQGNLGGDSACVGGLNLEPVGVVRGLGLGFRISGCIYVYMYIYIYACIYIYVYIYIYVCM